MSVRIAKLILAARVATHACAVPTIVLCVLGQYVAASGYYVAMIAFATTHWLATRTAPSLDSEYDRGYRDGVTRSMRNLSAAGLIPQGMTLTTTIMDADGVDEIEVRGEDQP